MNLSDQPANTGQRLPDITVFEYISKSSPSIPKGPKAWRLSDLAYKKKIILIGLIGAFTPVCHHDHLPGYIKYHKQFTKKGIDEIWCITSNDSFVLNAWGQILKIKDKLRLLSDHSAELASQLNATLDLSSRGMGTRSDRFVMIVDNGEIISFIKEETGQFKTTDAQSVLQTL